MKLWESGDYDDYENVAEISVGNTAITLKGNGGAYTLAIWTDGSYSYSIALSNGATVAEWQAILAGEI